MQYTENMLQEMQDLFAEGVSYDNIINQNKNDRKIVITDIAISKVPYVQYPGLSDNKITIIDSQ